MDPEKSSISSRLEGIQTQWTLVRQAHEDTVSTAAAARQALVMRYATAIRRYVTAMTRGSEDGAEIAQDAMVRLLQGDFAGADPERGRFRDLLKTAVRNMVLSHYRKQNRRTPVEYDVDLVSGEADEDNDPWEDTWRRNVMELTWSRLQKYEEANPGRIPYTVLRCRVQHPAESSQQLADRLTKQLQKTITSENLRQQLRRARLRFAELLVEEIAEGLDQPTPERVQDELVALGLYQHIKDVLPTR